MKSAFFFSLTAHGALLALVIVMGTLLSKPRMSYYAVDLVSSLPSGSSVSGPAVLTPAPKAAEAPREVEPEKPVAKEAIRVPSKEKKKLPAHPKAKPKSSAAFEAAMRAAMGQAPGANAAGSGVGAPGGSGAGVIGEAGPAFPYPWYLKAIADKLDKQWHPPHEFQSDTVCQIAFTISRDGQVSDSSLEKHSGDTFFDQLAMRAVLYANPLPPLPAGFPDETLRVHMKFVGKSL